MRDYDLHYLHMAIETARKAREHGNHPFGAVLVDEQGRLLLEAENTVVTGRDCTGHAETNLMRKACSELSPEALASCTLYTSTEPCAMCSGAIFWGGVSRVVFALSEVGLLEMAAGPAGVGADTEVGAGTRPAPTLLNLPCREVFPGAGAVSKCWAPCWSKKPAKYTKGFGNSSGSYFAA
jgi:tRNA(Arg) A34 adenosine deaminase TadA